MTQTTIATTGDHPVGDQAAPETARPRNWKRGIKFAAGAGAVWLTVEIIAAIAIGLWLTF